MEFEDKDLTKLESLLADSSAATAVPETDVSCPQEFGGDPDPSLLLIAEWANKATAASATAFRVRAREYHITRIGALPDGAHSGRPP